MIEKDLHVLEVARPALKEAEWFPFDACEVLSLVMAGIAHADVMVAATGDDEDNLVISLLAKQEFAVPRWWRGSTTQEPRAVQRGLGVDVAVSTPHPALAGRGGRDRRGMIKVMQFERGHVSLHAVTLADRSAAVGRTLRDLALPVDAAAVAVVREAHGRAQGGHRVRRRRRGPGRHLRGQRGSGSGLLVGEDQEEEEEEPEPAERGLQ